MKRFIKKDRDVYPESLRLAVAKFKELQPRQVTLKKAAKLVPFLRGEFASCLEVHDKNTGVWKHTVVLIESCGPRLTVFRDTMTGCVYRIKTHLGFVASKAKEEVIADCHWSGSGLFPLINTDGARNCVCRQLRVEWLKSRIRQLRNSKTARHSEAYNRSVQRDIDELNRHLSDALQGLARNHEEEK